MRRIFIAVLLLLVAVPALALTETEYTRMRRNSAAFARANRRLSQVWTSLRRELPKNVFTELRARQREWLSSGRDEATHGSKPTLWPQATGLTFSQTLPTRSAHSSAETEPPHAIRAHPQGPDPDQLPTLNPNPSRNPNRLQPPSQSQSLNPHPNLPHQLQSLRKLQRLQQPQQTPKASTEAMPAS